MKSDADPRYKQTQWLILVIACSAVLALTAIAVSAITWYRLNNSMLNVRSAREQLLAWNVAGSLVKDIELGQRGFLITADESYLQPFDKAVDQLPAQWIKLKVLMVKDVGVIGKVERAEKLAKDVTDYARSTIVLHRHGSTDEAYRMVIQGDGKQSMDELRTLFNQQAAALNGLILSRIQQMQFDMQAGIFTSLATGLLALGIGGIAIILIRRTVRETRRADRYAVERQRAEESQMQNSSFLAMMSHEIRTPLNAILGFGELAAAEAKSPATKRYAESIVAGGRALLQLLNDVLDLSKMDAGMMQLQPEPVDLRSMVDFCERLFRENAAKKGISLRSEVDTDLPTSLLMDEIRLRQVLINLMGNAVKFTSSGEVLLKIEGRAHEQDRSRWSVRITVKDTGPGIPEQEQARIFRPFIQSKSDTTSTATGTGLGLAIVQRFVGLMQGIITVTSQPGDGAAFIIEFPDVGISNRLPLTATQELQRDVDFNRLVPSKIVAADDNATNIELLQEIFRQTHHELFIARNGRDVVQLVKDVEPDLVLMDIRMPEMDGAQALKELRRIPQFKLLPVIAVTASSRVEEQVPDRAGFDSNVRKPFSRAELYQEMAQFLEEDKPQPDEAQEIRPTPAWPELLVTLKQWETERWPSLREAMSHAEVGDFARDLETRARKAECPPALKYASTLWEATETFSFSEMERLLDGFPEVMVRIEKAIHA